MALRKLTSVIVKTVLWVVGIVIGLPLVLSLLLYIPPVQDWAVQLACRKASESTGMQISVDRLRLKFPLNLRVEGVEVIQANGDTMVTARDAELRVAPLPLLKGDIALRGLRADSVYYQLGNSDSILWLRTRVALVDLNHGNMNFGKGLIDAGDALVDGAKISLVMKDSTAVEKNDTTATKPLRITANSIRLRNIDYAMTLPPVIDSLSAHLANATLNKGVVDIGKQCIRARSLIIDGVKAAYYHPRTLPPSAGADAKDTPDAKAITEPWVITADTLSLRADRALYAVSGAIPLAGLDLDYIEASGIDILVEQFRNAGPTISVPLRHLKATERCGLTLQAKGTFAMDSAAMHADDFELLTNHSRLTLDAMMGLAANGSDAAVPVALHAQGTLSGNDAAMALPLAAPMINALPQPRDVSLKAQAKGTMDRLDLSTLALALPGVMKVDVKGSVDHLLDPDRTGGNFTIDGAVTDPNAVRHSLTVLKIDPSIHIPALQLHGNATYHPGKAAGKLNVTTHGGSMRADASWVARPEDYSALVKLNGFPIDAFMPSLGIGLVTSTIDISGHGYNPLRSGTSAHADIDITSLQMHSQTYRNVTLKANVRGGQAEGSIVSANKNADLNLDFFAAIDSGKLDGTLHGDIRDLDLAALGLMKQTCGGSMTLSATGSYDPRAKAISAKGDIRDLFWRFDSLTFMSPDVAFNAYTDTALTRLSVDDDQMHLWAYSAASVDSIMAHVDRLTALIDSDIKQRRVDVDVLQSTIPPLELRLQIGPQSMAGRLMAEKGITIRSLDLQARNDSLLNLYVSTGGLNIGSTAIDSATINLNQHGKYLLYNGQMTNGPRSKLAEWANVTLRGYVADDRLSAFIDQRNQQGQQGYRLGAMTTLADSIITLRFTPLTPTIAYKPWTINSDNFLRYNFITRELNADLQLNGQGSSLHLLTSPLATADTIPGTSRPGNELLAQAHDIKIADWIKLSPFAPPMDGTLSADMRLHREKGNLIGRADLQLADFSYDKKRVGDIDLNLDVANDIRAKALHADGFMKVNGNKVLTLSGAVNDTTMHDPFLLDLSMIRFPLEVANPFLPADVAALSGTLNGTMKMTGSASAPMLDGFLQFDSAAVKVKMLGSTYNFSDRRIPVDSNIVRFDKFVINTLNDNPLTIDGTVDLRKLTAIGIDLNVQGHDMLLVNSQRARGADIYGKGYMDLDATVRGNTGFLVVDASVALLSGSDVTYVLTSGSSAITSYSNGDMVKFVSFADSTLVAKTDSVAPSMNLLLNAELEVQNNTTVNVDISADGKNRAQIQGYGDLDFSLTPQNTAGRLTGRYTIENGFVRYTPPLMSEKYFTFEPGSFVNFTGDILNPTLSLRAVDAMKANVTPSGSGNSRLVNFDVGLAVTGTLNNMDVAFDLSTEDDITIQNELATMSASQRANQAMNMLITGIYSGPGTKANANLGGNPLYSFLASQLNSLASNYVKGVDLTFGINQYDKTVEGVSSTATTYSYQISKSLLDNRIRIVVGGNYTTDASADENFAENLINDISFEYLLNRSGSMYVRVFRHTGFESILEGEVTATGVGFVYKRSLDSLRDMFRFGKKSPKKTATDSTK